LICFLKLLINYDFEKKKTILSVHVNGLTNYIYKWIG